jgi:hypothetical protein
MHGVAQPVSMYDKVQTYRPRRIYCMSADKYNNTHCGHAVLQESMYRPKGIVYVSADE